MSDTTEDADIIRYWRIKHHAQPLRWQQHGGGSRHILTIDGGHPIEYNVSHEGHTIFFRGGYKPLIAPCFVLEIDPDTPNTAILQEINRRNGQCFTDRHKDTRDIVRAAYTIASRRGITTIYLTDSSSIYCPESVRLPDLSFLTTGQTWYQSILPNLICVIPSGLPLEEYRTRVQTNTWRTVGHDLIDLDLSDTGIDIDSPGSAMTVLQAMKLDRQFCDFFSKNMHNLLKRSDIPSLSGTTWICHIPQRARRKTHKSTHRGTSRRHTRKSRPYHLTSEFFRNFIIPVPPRIRR